MASLKRISIGLGLGLGLGLTALGCGESSGDERTGTGLDSGIDSGIDSGLDSGMVSSGTSSTSMDSSSTGDTTSTDTSSGPFLDIGTSGTAETTVGDTGMGEACKKVDIVFAIDTSGSMGDEQSAITAALPQFANEMIATLDTVESLNIGVVASGPFTGNQPASCAVNGALVAQSSCQPFAASGRFITEADDIATAFPCNAALGLGGPGDNTTMQNVIGAVTDMQGAGECNEGFIRDDALLVIVILTDEEDDYDNPPGFNYFGSPGDPIDWYNTILAAKGGVDSNVVVRAIVQPPMNNVCPSGNNSEPLATWFNAYRIIEFTNMWTNGAVGDICDTANYSTYLMETLAVIDSACDNFMPPG